MPATIMQKEKKAAYIPTPKGGGFTPSSIKKSQTPSKVISLLAKQNSFY
jgi:hypothetical protein